MEKGLAREPMLQSLKALGLSEDFIRTLFGERWKETLQELPAEELPPERNSEA